MDRRAMLFMEGQRMSEPYNYQHFPQDHIDGPLFAAFRSHLPVGAEAPDGELLRLEDLAIVTLSEYWNARPVVIEFGSVT
jgi:hypothetical protein